MPTAQIASNKKNEETRVTMNEGIQLVKYLPERSNHLLLGQLVESFKEVFADRPWNEWLKCPVCQKYWGTVDMAELASMGFKHCNTGLVDFWSRDSVVSDILHEVDSNASCWLAVGHYNKVVGFCWGYPISADELEKKLCLSFANEIPSSVVEAIGYQDEVGVTRLHRRAQIGKRLVAHRLEDFLKQGLKYGVVRTRQLPEPSVTFKWYTERLGYKVLASYPDDDGRVILGRELAGLLPLLKA